MTKSINVTHVLANALKENGLIPTVTNVDFLLKDHVSNIALKDSSVIADILHLMEVKRSKEIEAAHIREAKLKADNQRLKDEIASLKQPKKAQTISPEKEEHIQNLISTLKGFASQEQVKQPPVKESQPEEKPPVKESQSEEEPLFIFMPVFDETDQKQTNEQIVADVMSMFTNVNPKSKEQKIEDILKKAEFNDISVQEILKAMTPRKPKEITLADVLRNMSVSSNGFPLDFDIAIER